MRHASHSEGHLSLNDRTTVAERVAGNLVARYPSKTADCVAADTGIKAETIQKILNRVSMPSGLVLLRLVAAYGPDFLAACMGSGAPSWLVTAEREKRAAELKARRAAIDAELAQIEG